MLQFQQETSSCASRVYDGTTCRSSSQDDIYNELEDSRHKYTAEQESLTSYVSFAPLVQQRVSSSRCSCDAGYFAMNIAADNSLNAAAAGDEGDSSSSEDGGDSSSSEDGGDSSSSEDEGDVDELPTEDTNEPGHPCPGDAVTESTHTSPNVANGQTPPSQSDKHYHPTLQPVAAKDASTVGVPADKNPGNLRRDDLHGKSKAPQHDPPTVAAKGEGPAASHQLCVGKGDSESEQAIDQELKRSLKTQAEQTVKELGQVNKEAKAKECVEEPREGNVEMRAEETIEMPEEENVEVQLDEATDESHESSSPPALVLADIVHINSEVTTYSISGVINTMSNVEFDPHDRHE